MTAYYNEFDLAAAQWLRNLIDAGHIAPGIVDERSIEDVHPSDLKGFAQCHFFAGIGVWSYALRQARWRDDRPVWTGSCPCQPFSSAGKGTGFDDERHLWPAFHHLIKVCKPATVLGEQVASKDAGPWIDLVHTDLEALGYAFGAVPFPSAGIGAPHIRDRLYWVADAAMRGKSRGLRECGSPGWPQGAIGGHGAACKLGNASSTGLERHAGDGGAAGRKGSTRSTATAGVFGRVEHARQDHDASQIEAACHGQPQTERPANQLGGSGVSSCGLGHADRQHTGRDGGDGPGAQEASDCSGPLDGPVCIGSDVAGRAGDPGPTNGFWRAADWLLCRDGKWRPVEPGTFPLAHGAPARVVRLRAYGNAINAQAAQAFIECVMESA